MTDRPSDDDRRRAPRYDTEGRLEGRIALELSSEVLQLSVGGMGVALAEALAIGSRHRFALEIDGEVVEVEGIVRNRTPLPEGKGSGVRYQTGVEFVGLDERCRAVIERFVRRRSQG